ncbi:MAG TPA: thiamine phosphate synthase [Gemmatimonadales bacterium]|nr:thiamine phosphate synthase [Gemmatimonadales bacterium]
MKPALPRLHAITDERIARRPDLAEILDALSGIPLAAHARGHSLSGREHYELAVRLIGRPPVRLFVNDRLDIALATRACGVQLSRSGLLPEDARRLAPEWWIGCSVHSLEEARTARDWGADYLLAGPVYHTATHPGGAPLGLGLLSDIVLLGPPVIAIGGMTPERARAATRAGAYGVAAIRAIWDAADPQEAASSLLEAVG